MSNRNGDDGFLQTVDLSGSKAKPLVIICDKPNWSLPGASYMTSTPPKAPSWWSNQFPSIMDTLSLWIVIKDGWLLHIVAAGNFLDVANLLYGDWRLRPGEVAMHPARSQHESLFRLVREQCGTREAETLLDYARMIAAEMGGPSTFLICSFQDKKIRHDSENYGGSP